MRTLLPLNDRVLVRRVPSADTTASGLVIPDIGKEKPTEGEVVAVASGNLVLPGQRVLFGKYSGTEVTIDGKELVILSKEDLLGVFVPEATTIRA